MENLKSKELSKTQHSKLLRKIKEESQIAVARLSGVPVASVDRIKNMGKGSPKNIASIIYYLSNN